MSCKIIPTDRDNDAYSYMAWCDITDSTTPQYRLRENYIRKGHLTMILKV